MHANPNDPLAHRDIKMENILIDSTGILKLIDMGHAGPINSYVYGVGTREYWTPEQNDNTK
jgi:serine/threonine protein kinase